MQIDPTRPLNPLNSKYDSTPLDTQEFREWERAQLESYFDRLWPLPRSLTGRAYRESLDILCELVPFENLVFQSNEKVYDWTVPLEWNVEDAYIIDPNGQKIIDFKKNNLHLVNYSIPFEGSLTYSELKSHLHTIPDLPEAIPYVTSYYKPTWGFCLTQTQFQKLPQEGLYKIKVQTSLTPGRLVVGEAVLPPTVITSSESAGPNSSTGEILLSSYLCHPSMANNELSGPLVLSFLYQRLLKKKNRRHTYRFVIVPETIGSICYLSRRGQHLQQNLKAGYVLTCCGDPGLFTYKMSRQGNSLADRAALAVLSEKGEFNLHTFFPGGSDERQYCSPGFNLPVGSIMRSMYSHYPEYHTSLDNKEFITFQALQETIDTYEKVFDLIEANQIWFNLKPHCEPQLSPRGLYPTTGAQRHRAAEIEALMWVLNMCDGQHDVLDIIDQSKLEVDLILGAIEKLKATDLLGLSQQNRGSYQS